MMAGFPLLRVPFNVSFFGRTLGIMELFVPVNLGWFHQKEFFHVYLLDQAKKNTLAELHLHFHLKLAAVLEFPTELRRIFLHCHALLCWSHLILDLGGSWSSEMVQNHHQKISED